MDCPLAVGANVGPTNLEYLKHRKVGGSAIAALAKKTFEESQALTLGWGHTLKKYGTGAAVFVGTVAVPVAIAGTAIYASLPSTKDGWFSLGMSGAGIGLGNQGVAKLTGINIGSKLLTLISMALVTGAALASNAAMGSYTEIEEDVKKAQKGAQDKIAKSLTDTYNQIAQALSDKLQKIENPHELFLYKVEAEALAGQLDEIRAQFAKLGLNGVESTGILAEFTSVLSVIQNIPFALDAEKGSEKFNFELMTMEEIPQDRAVAGSIPSCVRAYVEQARENQLGTFHSVKKYCNSTMAGLTSSVAAAAVVALAGFGAQEALKGSEVEIPMGGIIAVGVPTGLAVGAKTARSLFQKYEDERTKKDLIVVESYAAAKEQLKEVYVGLADSLNKCYNDKQAKAAAAIRAKLPAIEKQIADLQIPELTTEEVLAPLYKALESNKAKFDSVEIIN